MNKLELFFIRYIAPYTPFSATSYYPSRDLKPLAETLESYSSKGGVRYRPESNRYYIPDGTTANILIENEVIQVFDWREREGHTPGSTIIVNQIEKHNLDEKSSEIELSMGKFQYQNDLRRQNDGE